MHCSIDGGPETSSSKKKQDTHNGQGSSAPTCEGQENNHQEMMTLVCIHKSVQSHLHAFHTLNKFQHKVCMCSYYLFVDADDQGSGNPTTGGDSETLGM